MSRFRTLGLLILLSTLTWLSFMSSASARYLRLHREHVKGATDMVRPNQAATRQTANTADAFLSSSSMANESSFPAYHVLRQYQAWHSAAVLASEPPETWQRRRFVIIPYWCPDRLGNALHSLLNNVAWALLTNRTLLLDFDETNPPGNSVLECRAALALQSWVPWYPDWRDRLLLRPVPIEWDIERHVFDAQIRAVWFPVIDDVYHDRPHHPRMASWAEHPGDHKAYWPGLPQPAVAHQLYAHGRAFAYGLLLRNIFVWPSRQVQSNETYRIVVHSRHIAHGDDGAIVSDEQSCLDQLLQQQKQKSPSSSSCEVYVLSDRAATVTQLSAYVEDRWNCSIRANTSTQSTLARIREHGPWSGVGFVRDLQALPNIKAWIGDVHRSSFQLVHELVVHDAVLAGHPLEECRLPHKSPHGYSYDNNSSVQFIRQPADFPPLFPVRVLQQYQKWHAVSQVPDFVLWNNTNRSSDGRLWGYLPWTCPTSPAQAHETWQSLLAAVWTNRTLLLHEIANNKNNNTDPGCPHWPAWILRWPASWSPPVAHNSVFSRDKLVVRLPTALPPELAVATYHQFANPPRNQVLQQFWAYGQDFVHGLLQEWFWNQPESVAELAAASSVDTATTRTLVAWWQPLEADHHVHTCVRNTRLSQPCRIVVWDNNNRTINSTTTLVSSVLETTAGCTVSSRAQRSSWQDWWHYRREVERLEWHAWWGTTQNNPLWNHIVYRRTMNAWKLGRFPVQVTPLPTCRPMAQEEGR